MTSCNTSLDKHDLKFIVKAKDCTVLFHIVNRNPAFMKNFYNHLLKQPNDWMEIMLSVSNRYKITILPNSPRMEFASTMCRNFRDTSICTFEALVPVSESPSAVMIDKMV